MNQRHKDVQISIVEMVSAVRIAGALRLAAFGAVLTLILAACGTPGPRTSRPSPPCSSGCGPSPG